MPELSSSDLRAIQETLSRAKLQMDLAHEVVTGGAEASSAAISRLRQLAEGNSGCGCGNCGCTCGEAQRARTQIQ